MKRDFFFKASAFSLSAMFFCSLLAVPFQFSLYASLFCYAISVLKRRENIFVVKPDLSETLFIIFFLTTVITTATANNKFNAMEGFLAALLYLLVYWYFKIFPVSWKQYRLWMNLISASLIIFCGFALLHYTVFPVDITLFPGMVFSPTNPQLSDRPLISIFQQPAVAANLIVIPLLFVLCFLTLRFKELTWVERIMGAAAIMIDFLTIVATHNRGSLLILSAGIITTAVLSRKFQVLLLLALFGFLIACLPNEKFQNTLSDPINSPNMPGRFLQYKAALDVFTHSNWLTGIGILNFQDVFREKYPSLKENISYIHNNYLSLLIETGILGFLSFFGFLGLSLVKLGKICWKKANPAALTAFGLAVGFLLNSLFDSLFYVIPIALLILIGLGLGSNEKLKLEFDEKSKANPQS